MPALPTGTVTFLFTDLEGSTRLWEKYPEAMQTALARHDDILRDAIEGRDGVVFSTMGDGLAAVFASAPDATSAVLDAQLSLGAEAWGETGPLLVRMALHSDEGQLRAPGEYVNRPLNRCARLMAVAHGGQVLLSDSTVAVVRDGLPQGSSLADLGEHRLRDLADAVHVFQLMHPALRAEFPPLRSLDARPGNLPRQVTTFVGRGSEIAAISDLVRARSLVTLTGVGGVGKTRLAVQVAAEVVPDFPDGAWVCELAPVADPGTLWEALAAALQVQPVPGRALDEVVLEYLASKQLLVVLDNCEHLLEAVARVVGAVGQQCAGVSVLATSREGLAVAGEQLVAVPSLSLPAVDADGDALTNADAVRLFADRAHDAKSDFVITEQNARAVGQLCRRLDGIPLAIELAAARVRSLTPDDLLARLDQRFRLLTRGSRATLERHQTLRNTIDWSYDLLNESERDALNRLAVFAGGCDLLAAEAVLSGGSLDVLDVADVLGQLVDKSLVVVDEEDGEVRFRLLETIRQYAQERLNGEGEAADLQRGHAEYYTRFAEVAVAGLDGADEIAWTNRIDRELDNIRAAMEWAISTADTDTALRMLAAVCETATPWCSRINPTLAPLAAAAICLPGAQAHALFPAAAASAAFLVAVWDRNYELADRLADDALEAEQRLGTEPLALPWIVRANSVMLSGTTPDEYIHHWERAVEIWRRAQSPSLPPALAFLSAMRAHSGETSRAAREAEDALGGARQLGAPGVIAIALAALGMALADSNPERAVTLAREAVAVEHTRGPNGASMTLAIASEVIGRHGTNRQRLEFYGDAFEQLRERGGGIGPGLYPMLGRVADLLAAEDPGTAAVILGAVETVAAGLQLARDQAVERAGALAALDAALDEEQSAELRAEGARMSETEIVAYASSKISSHLER